MIALAGMAFAGEKQDVCHHTGQPDHIVMINISVNAVQTHLDNHGDTLATTYYPDDDGDGYGAAGEGVVACEAPDGYTDNPDDCDDADPSTNPGAEDDACDGVDSDCDGAEEPGDECGGGDLCLPLFADGGSYLFCNQAVTWHDAQAACEAEGADLVTIDSASEDSLISTFAEFLGMNHGGYVSWIGFNDLDAEGSFTWVSGDSPSYTNWHAGEPNNVGDEDCAAISGAADGWTWNDLSCSGELHAYTCEY